MADVTIREVPASEARSLLPSLKQVQDLHVSALPGVFRADPSDVELGEFLKEWLATEGVVALAAHSGTGDVVGCAVYEIEDMPPRPLIRAWRNGLLKHIVVDETCRGTGIGSRLVEEVKSRLRADGIDRVRAHHFAFNDASSALMRKAGLLPLLVTVEGRT